MPRKKQGLRSYHHKSRNGCLQCKRRRVKCTMQAPACANCIRRNEVCEYAGVVDQSTSVTQWHNGLADANYYNFPEGFINYAPQNLAFNMATGQPSFPDNAITLDPSIGTMLKSVMGRSWLTPAEVRVWSNAIVKNISKYPYLQHCIFSISCLRRDIVEKKSKSGISAEAYEHQMAASALFRQDATAVNADNWVATFTFNIFMLIFEFGSQTACSHDHFNLVGTLRVIRSSNAIEQQTRPYFRASDFWRLVASRAPAVKMEVDQPLRANLLALGGVIADSTSSDIKKAGVNSQALKELSRWIFSCDAHPLRWDQYCEWPGHLPPAFLDILLDDDVALLLVIHWAAVLYRSPKPPVFNWAKRVGMYSLGQLKQREKWDSLLSWPLQVLQASKNAQLKIVEMGEPVKMEEVTKSLESVKIEDNSHHGSSSVGLAAGWHPGPMTSNWLNDSSTSTATHSSISTTSSPYDSSLLVPGGAYDRTRSTSPYDTSLVAPGGSFDPPGLTSGGGGVFYTTSHSSSDSIPIDPSLLMDQAGQARVEGSQSPSSMPGMGIGLDLFA